MIAPLRHLLVLTLLASFSLQGHALSAQAHTALIEAIDGPHRSPVNQDRDRYRHPYETLSFFGVAPDLTVVEIWPGGGWYTDILAPYLKKGGKLYAAHFDPQAGVPFFQHSREDYSRRLSTHSSVFKGVELTSLLPGQADSAGPVGQADRVLTFRNVHNWMKAGNAEAVFAVFYELLKPGGILGVVEHRAKPGTPLETMIASGYVTEAYVIQLATDAGFVLLEKSEINANPLDTKDHPAGVWSLPPTLSLGQEDRDHYLAIGESDRMTLKFVKPE